VASIPHTMAADSSDMAQTLTKLKHERRIISKKIFLVKTYATTEVRTSFSVYAWYGFSAALKV